MSRPGVKDRHYLSCSYYIPVRFNCDKKAQGTGHPSTHYHRIAVGSWSCTAGSSPVPYRVFTMNHTRDKPLGTLPHTCSLGYHLQLDDFTEIASA